MLLSGLTDVAYGKPHTQSSYSGFSADFDDSLNEDVGKSFCFHTEIEDAPWWQVDLGFYHTLEYVVVHNRKDVCQERARTLKVEVSADGLVWTLVHAGLCHFGAEPSGEPLSLPLGGVVSARHVRLALEERNYFHLSQVQVLVKSASIALAEIAERFGLDLIPAKDHPDPSFFTGYSLRSSDGRVDGQLLGLSIGENGAFGNCTMQYTLAISIARRMDLRYIKISENDRCGLIRWREPFTVDGITFIPAGAPLPEGGIFLHGFFFDPTPFVRAGCVASAKESHCIIRTYVRKLFNVLPDHVAAKPSDQLMIHIRSGDIFDKWVNPAYVQPPVSFYIAVVELLRAAGKICHAVLVYENRLNPVIEAVEAYLVQAGLPFTVSSGTIDSDICALINAKYYTFGLGTFGPAVCQFSDDIETVFYFSPGVAPGFETIPSVRHVVQVVDTGGGYLKPGEWQNTPDQRQMMLSYPIENLGFAYDDKWPLNDKLAQADI